MLDQARIGEGDLQTAGCTPTIQPRALSTPDAGRYVGQSEGYLKKARRGLTDIPGPKFRKIGKRVVYLREDLDTWLDGFGPSIANLPKADDSDRQSRSVQ